MIVRKLLVSDGRTERELLLVGTIVVGRDPSCQLNDLDPLLSRRHAEFVPTSKGVTVRDLKSRNGILVNGDKVPEHALKPGDVIQLGHLHVRYVEERMVKSAEDHSRVRAKTETGIEVPTMAPVRPSAPAVVAAAAAAAPTTAARAITGTSPADETDMDVTIAPAVRQAAMAPAPSSKISAPPTTPKKEDADLDATVAPARRSTSVPVPVAASAPAHPDEQDLDATVAPLSRRPASSAPAVGGHPSSAGKDQDADATRVPWTKGAAVAEDPDATVALSRKPSVDETRAQAAKPHAPAQSTEARLVANASLVVTEASPSCQTVIGARPNTLVGGQLSDAISRTLRFVATGDGPSSLSVSIVRAASGGTITVTVRAGQATENHS
jgi:pSer/pThr/pTyr-binding forkhead associated (FHA) protein